MKIVTHRRFYRTLFALLSVMVLFWIPANGHETLVYDGDKTNFINQTAPSLTIAADLGQFGKKAGINAINEYPVSGLKFTEASLRAFLLEIFGLLFLALVWLRLQIFVSRFSILLRRSRLVIFILISLSLNTFGQPPVIEFTQNQNDHEYTISAACGIIAGGGQNDLDIYSGYTNGTLQWQTSLDQSTWSDAPGPTSTTTQYVLNPIYLYFESVPGTYYFRLLNKLTNGNTNTSNTITLHVILGSNLTAGSISGTGTLTFCGSGNPTAFTQTSPTGGTGTYTYQWQSSTDGVNYTNITGATNSTYDPPLISQTTYYRRIVVSGGCRAISTPVTITITTATPPGAITGPQIVCPGTSGLVYSIATVPGAAGYTWTVPAGWNITAGQGTTNITATSGNPGQNGNITVTVINSCAGSNSSSLAVTVSSPVSLTVQPTIVEGCTGILTFHRDFALAQPTTVSLSYGGTATNGTDITSGGVALPSSITILAGQTDFTINFLAVADGVPDAGEVLNIQIVQSCPCNPAPSCSSKTITIYEPLTITAIANNVACGSNNGSITVNPTNGSPNIQYSINGGALQSSNLFASLAPGTYTIRATDLGSCAAVPEPAPILVTVNTGIIIANAGPDVSICSGGSVQLQGSGGTIYSWTPVTGLSNPNIPNPIANPTATTTYTLKVTTGTCSATDDVIITVNPSPVVTITGNKDICIGNSTTLTASGGGTYLWNTGSANSSITVTPLINTTYSVLVTSNGCTTNATVNVVVHPLPTAVMNGDATICSGDLATLNVTLTGTAPWTITYSDGTTSSSVFAPSIVNPFKIAVTPAITSTYHLVSVTDAWGCGASSLTGTATITVNPTPVAPTSASVTPDHYCPGSGIPTSVTLIANGAAGTTVRWHLDSWNGILLGEVLTGDPLVVPSPATTTTYYARTVNSCGESSDYNTATVTILDAPTVPTSITYTNNKNTSAYCVNSPPTGTFRLTAVGSLNATGYQWFTGDGCGTGTLLQDSPSNSYSLSPIPLVTTIYYVRATNSTCAPSPCANIPITVYPPSIAGNITGVASVCSGNSPSDLTLSGYTGSIQWQSSTDNLTFIDIPGATADVLTSAQMGTISSTTYYRAKVQSGILPNACIAVFSPSFTVTANPVVPVITGPATACINSTTNTYTTLAGMSNYAWSVSAGGTVTGGSGTNTITVTWNTLGPQTVSVNYTNLNGCTAITPTVFNVTVSDPPTIPTITVSGYTFPYSYCLNAKPASLRFNASGGSGSQWFSDNCGETQIGSGGSIQISGPAVTTTYWVRSSNGSCVSECYQFTITVNDPAAPTGSTPQTFCAGNNSTVANLAATGTAIKWYAASTGGSALLSTTALVNGTHYYASQTVGGCESTSRFDVTANVVQPPAQFTLTGGGIICEGEPDNIHVGLGGSEIGVNYQLYQAALPVGLPLAGTGSAIDFGIQGNGSYTVTAISSAPPNCTRPINGSVSITPTQPIYTAYTVTVTGGGVFCAGGAGVSIGLSGSESFLNYQLFNGANPVGSAVPGTGTALNFGLQTAAGIYSIVATRVNPPLCSKQMDQKATVTVNALPQGTLTANGPFCASGTGRLTWTATAGIEPYAVVYNDGTANRTASGVASGTPFNVATNPVTSTTTYNVVSVTDANGCVRSSGFTGPSATITVNALPQGSLSGNTICPGGTGQFTFTSSAGEGPFSLVISGETYDGIISGTPFNANPNPSGTTAYTLTSITDISTCERTSNFTGSSAMITVNALPQGSLSGNTICPGGTGQFTFTSSAGAGPFSLVISGVTYNSVVSGAPFNANPNPSGTTVYTLTSITDISTCERTTGFTGASATITVNALPQGGLSGSTICPGGTGQFTFTSTAGAGPFSLVISGVTYNGIVSGTPFNANPNPAITTSYTLTSITDNSTCERTSGFTGASATITVNALPQGSLTANGPFCVTGTGQLTWSASSGTGPFTVIYNDGNANRTANNIVSGAAFNVFTTPVISTTTYTLVSVTDAHGCIRSSGFTGGSVTTTVNPLPTAFNVTGGGTNCAASTGVPVGISGSQLGVDYQLYVGGVATGFSVAGTGSSLSFGNQTAAGTYTVVAINTSTSCSQNMTGNATVTINTINPGSVDKGASNPGPACAPLNPNTAGSTTDAIGSGLISYSWEQSTDGGSTWQTAVGGTTTGNRTFNPDPMNVTTILHRVATSTLNGVPCSANSNDLTYVVWPLPDVASILPGGPIPDVCVNSQFTLTNATPGGVWSTANSLIATVSGGVVTGVGAGSVLISYTVTDIHGCSKTANRTVNIIALPILTYNTAVCVGSTMSLSPSSGGIWTSSDPSKATVTASGLITAVSAGSVTFTFTSSTAPNCSATTSTVTINPLPITSAIYHR